jgi:hypothetical protein
MDTKQFERGEQIARELIDRMYNEQRGPALFALLLATQVIVDEWIDMRRKESQAPDEPKMLSQYKM